MQIPRLIYKLNREDNILQKEWEENIFIFFLIDAKKKFVILLWLIMR